MTNIPKVKLGIVAVSRNCFPIELSQKRRSQLVAECKKKKMAVTEIQTIVENENDALKALEEIRQKNINGLLIFLGNFGPEGPETIMAKAFEGPVMFAAAAEESGETLVQGRGDAYCGMLNASYNIHLRKVKAYIPEYPVGTPAEVAVMAEDFMPMAAILLGVHKLKIIAFGPRPEDFYACHAPLKPLYDIGVEVMENSELDLYDLFLAAQGDPRIKTVTQEMSTELGQGNVYPDLLEKLAQFEVALLKHLESNLGASRYAVFANKCWPAFEKFFGFVPCYVNARLASRGIPISCEVDVYGALSEYMLACATGLPVTLLDINNTVPYDMYEQAKLKGTYQPHDLFMGFHCGNTPGSCLTKASMHYQVIMHRLMEPGKEPLITRGTLEGTIRPGPITLFRLQGSAEAGLRSYVAQGEVLNIDPKTFGGVGVFAVPEMARFYRHVLIEKRFPHHTAVAFKHTGKALFSVVKMLGIDDVSFNRPKGFFYQSENPYA